MRILQTAYIVLCICSVLHDAKFSSDSEFIGAVYEHVFVTLENRTEIPTRQEALDVVMDNMNVYEQQILEAKAQNASIIVFPEYGLTGFGYTRESFQPFLENIPDPTKTEWNACEEPQPDNSTATMSRLSCLARNNDIYIVVNMGDIKPCNKTTDPDCPADGRYQFNTNVVFDNHGKLIARYHKQHPFLNEMKVVNRPVEPEFITFDTPFGKFGTFTCFDVLFHDPAVPLVTKYNIDHVVFPTAWFDVLPLFAAIGFHSSWARGMGVNYLASNTHVPYLLNTGSGIYSSNGARKFYRSLSGKGSLLTSSLPVQPRNVSRNETSLVKDNTKNDYLGNDNKTNGDEFYLDLFGDLFLFKELSKENDTLNVCYKGSTICCSLTYKMATKRSDEMYALGVFDGLHTKEGQYYLRICGLIKCLNLSRNGCGQRVYNASSIFEYFMLKSQLSTPYVFPQVVADGVSLLPGEWDNDFPATSLRTTQKLSKGLLTAALFGRVYSLDPTPPSPVPTTTRIQKSTDLPSKFPISTTDTTTNKNPACTTDSANGNPTCGTIPQHVPSILPLMGLLLVQTLWYV